MPSRVNRRFRLNVLLVFLVASLLTLLGYFGDRFQRLSVNQETATKPKDTTSSTPGPRPVVSTPTTTIREPGDAPTSNLDFLVSGIVLGDYPETPLQAATVRLSHEGGLESRMEWPPLETVTDNRGRFSFVTQSSMEALDDPSWSPVLHAEHPLAHATDQRISRESISLSDDRRNIRIHTTLILDRFFPVTGSIRESSPRGSVPAFASIVRPLDNGRPLQSLTRVPVAEDGSFRAVLEEWESEELWVLGVARDHLPASKSFYVLPDRVTETGELQLAAGVSISGRVTSLLGAGDRARKLTVQSRVRAGVHFWDPEVGSYLWAPSNDPHLRVGSTDVLNDGTFYVGGLVPGEYILSLKYSCSTAVQVQTSVTSTAPATGVVIQEVAALHRFEVSDAETHSSIWAAKLVWNHVDGFACWIGAGSAGVAAVDPEVSYQGLIVADGYISEAIDLPALPSGGVLEHKVILTPINSDAETRVLKVVTQLGDPVVQITLRIRRREDAERGGDDGWLISRFLRSETGEYRLPPLSDGEYELLIQPNTLADLFDTLLVGVRINVQVPTPSGRDTMIVSEGSSLVLRITDEKGRSLQAQSRVVALDGGFVSDHWMPLDEPPQTYIGWVPGRGAVRSKHPLPPGTYEILVECTGYSTVRRKVELVAGSREEVDIVLAADK